MTLDDDASMREEQFLDAALKKRKPTGPNAIGYCLSCNAILSDHKRWCDAWCMEDWQLAQEAKIRNNGKM